MSVWRSLVVEGVTHVHTLPVDEEQLIFRALDERANEEPIAAIVLLKDFGDHFVELRVVPRNTSLHDLCQCDLDGGRVDCRLQVGNGADCAPIHERMVRPLNFAAIQSWLDHGVEFGVFRAKKEGMRGFDALPQNEVRFGVAVLELSTLPEGLDARGASM